MIESVNERMRLNAEVGAVGELCKGMGGGGRARQTKIQPGCKLVLYPATELYKDICYISHVLYIKTVYFEYSSIFPGFLGKFQSQRDKSF